LLLGPAVIAALLFARTAKPRLGSVIEFLAYIECGAISVVLLYGLFSPMQQYVEIYEESVGSHGSGVRRAGWLFLGHAIRIGSSRVRDMPCFLDASTETQTS
jgi:hypothetical protein